MPSVCISNQSSYQQFQPTNGNILMTQSGIPQQHLHQQQHQQQQHHFPHQKHHFQQHIAPKAPLGNSQMLNIQSVDNSTSSLGNMLSKKKGNYANLSFGEQMPSVARRNARERNRVKQVNNGFVNLRQHIPTSIINALSHGGRGASKKLSKVDTLRIAVEYIRGLQDLLEDARPGYSHYRHHHNQKLFISDDSSNDDSFNAHSCMGSPNSSTLFSFDQQQQCQQQQELKYQAHSYHSETSNSPPPSFIGESNSNCMQYIKLEVPEQQQSSAYPQKERQPQQIKFESFDSFSDDRADDDEELLDYISSWQEG